MMGERIERLASLLTAEKGFERLEPAGSELSTSAELPPFAFVGTRRRWLSPTMIALVDADGLDLGGMNEFAARFFALVHGTYSYWAGSFGTLCFVFERPPPPATIEHIKKLKRSSSKVWMASWTVDLSTGRVIPHSGGPFKVYPGRAYIEEAIRR